MSLLLPIMFFSLVAYIFIGCFFFHVSFKYGEKKWEGESDFVAEPVDYFAGFAWPLLAVAVACYWIAKGLWKVAGMLFIVPNRVASHMASWVVK